MERENFYILLELSIDPPETDPAVIEKQIKRKKAEWSKLRNHPTKGLQAQKNISLIPEMEKVMLDPEKRAEELEAAKGEIQKGRESKYPEIDRHIDILMGKGYIAREEAIKLANRHGLSENVIQDRINRKKQEKFGHIDRAISLRMDKGYITEAEISKLAKRYSLSEDEVRKRVRCPIKKDDKEKVEGEPRHIDKSLEKSINDNLKILGKNSLYNFLDLPESADLESLRAQAGRKKKELASISKKDASVTAGNTLAGHCMTIFKTDESRNAYDITLARSRLAALDSDIDIAAINGKVRYEYYDVLLQKALEFGMDQQEADTYISAYCSRKGYKIEKAPKKRKTLVIAGAAAAVCLLAAVIGGFVFSHIQQSKMQEAKYQALMSEVEAAANLEKKQNLLENYLSAHPSNTYSDSVRSQIDRIENRMEEQQYRQAAKAAKKQASAGKYEAAVNGYQSFIQNHSNNAYIKEARKQIKHLRAQIEQKDFEALKRVLTQGRPDEKIAACQDYLKTYPESENSRQVRQLIREMSREYYIFLKDRLSECEQNDDWQTCVALCRNYIDLYDNSHADQLRQRLPGYERHLKDQRIFQTLKNRAKAKGDDFQAAKKLYQDYLEAYPNTTIKAEIRREIDRLEQRARQKRMQAARQEIRSALAAVQNRFSEPRAGVVLDSRTGLMWTLVDSSISRPDACLTYDKAQNYVKQLRTGGYSDWRLPKPEELAGIYKNKPFFPGDGSDWYWSSQNYSRYSEGWHKIVDTVSGKNSTRWQTQQRDAAECGTVRAVRSAD